MDIFNFSVLFLNSFLVFCLIPLSNLIGNILYGNWIRKNIDARQVCFSNTILGFIWLLGIFAIAHTSGRTIFSLILILLAVQYLSLKISPDFKIRILFTRTDFSIFAKSGLIFLGLVIFQALRIGYFNKDYIHLGWEDYSLYSDFAENLCLTGVERPYNWLVQYNSKIHKYSTIPLPYHYPELWVDALILKIASFKGVFAFNLIFIPFVNTFVVLSLYNLSLSFIKKRINTYILLFASIILSFYCGCLPLKLGGIPDTAFNYPRVFLFYVFFSLFIIFFRKGYKNSAYFFLAFIAFCNILYTPTICIVLVCLFIYNKLFKIDKSYTPLLLSIFVAFLTYLFYFLIFKTDTLISTANKIDDIEKLIKKGINYFFRLQLARIWFFYLPITIFILLNFKNYLQNKILKNNSTLILVFCLIELISLAFASFYPHLEGGSFNSIFLNPMMTCFAFIALASLYNSFQSLKSKIISILIISQAVYGVYFTYNASVYLGKKVEKNFLEKIYSSKFTNKKGVYISDSSKINTFVFNGNALASLYSSVLDIKENGFTQSSLVSQIRTDDIKFEEVKSIILESPIFKFASAAIQNQTPINRNQLNINFIKFHQISYIIIEPNLEVPQYLSNYISHSLKDKLSGIQVVFLKY